LVADAHLRQQLLQLLNITFGHLHRQQPETWASKPKDRLYQHCMRCAACAAQQAVAHKLPARHHGMLLELSQWMAGSELDDNCAHQLLHVHTKHQSPADLQPLSPQGVSPCSSILSLVDMHNTHDCWVPYGCFIRNLLAVTLLVVLSSGCLS
jgi:hypothetical protein